VYFSRTLLARQLIELPIENIPRVLLPKAEPLAPKSLELVAEVDVHVA
jgi:hypothetical protein